MDKHFEQLVKGIREMNFHIAAVMKSGKRVRGVKITELPAPNLRKSVSQSIKKA